MSFVRVSNENGLWKQLIEDWERQCRSFDEDLQDYAQTSLPVLESLATETQRRNAAVYAIRNEHGFEGICQLNVSFLPGYTGEVLRVRHIVHAPRFDFDQSLHANDYVRVLGGTLAGAFDESNSNMPSQHIKFHFKSPAEKLFFDRLQKALERKSVFSSIELKGSWLYITK